MSNNNPKPVKSQQSHPPITKEEIIKCMTEPVYFIETYLKIEVTWKWLQPFRLYKYQKYALKEYEDEKSIFVLKSRQLWFTTLAAAYALWKSLLPWSSILFLSKKESDAMWILRKVRIMYDNLPEELKVSVTNYNATTIEFYNKNRIHSLPATERAWAWFSASLIICDEFSWFPWAKAEVPWENVWRAIYPTLSTWWKAIVQSTPKWLWNKFAELYHAENWFKKLKFHWTDHPKFGKDKKLSKTPEDWWGHWTSPWAEDMKSNLVRDAWNQEFELDFLQSWRPVFDIQSLWLTHVIDEDILADSRFAIWADLASWSSRDFSVIQVINVDTGKQVLCYRSQDPLDVLWKKCLELAGYYNNAKIAFENNSWYWLSFMKFLRWYPNLYRQKSFDKHREKNTNKWGWNTNRASKERMITDLNIALLHWRMKLVDEETVKELRVFQYDDNDQMSAMDGFKDDCFVAWTLVLTNKWQIPIEDIKIWDMVLTRNWYFPVINTRSKVKEVITNIGLTGTPDHPVITTKWERDLSLVNDMDTLYIWNEKLLRIEEKGITDIPNQKEGSIDVITGGIVKPILALLRFIGRYGLIVIELFLRGWLYITKMAIRLIIILITWRWFQPVSTHHCTPLSQGAGKCLGKMDWSKLSDLLSSLESGRRHLKREKCIEIMDWSKLPGQQRHSQNGEKNPRQKKFIEKQRKNLLITQSQKKKNARSVWKSLLQKLKEKNSAVESVTVGTIGENITKKQRVYNLHVADTPEYFANNILVHNCVMSLAIAWQCALSMGKLNIEWEIQSPAKKWITWVKKGSPVVDLNGRIAVEMGLIMPKRKKNWRL